eukprot:3854501-Prymnesium_polylepis.2
MWTPSEHAVSVAPSAHTPRHVPSSAPDARRAGRVQVRRVGGRPLLPLRAHPVLRRALCVRVRARRPGLPARARHPARFANRADAQLPVRPLAHRQCARRARAPHHVTSAPASAPAPRASPRKMGVGPSPPRRHTPRPTLLLARPLRHRSVGGPRDGRRHRLRLGPVRPVRAPPRRRLCAALARRGERPHGRPAAAAARRAPKCEIQTALTQNPVLNPEPFCCCSPWADTRPKQPETARLHSALACSPLESRGSGFPRRSAR